jgi:hypothetical protein
MSIIPDGLAERTSDGDPITFVEASGLGLYELAARVGDVARRPVRVPHDAAVAAGIPAREPRHDLAELAEVASLRAELDMMLPLLVHRAATSGADLGALVAATGMDPVLLVSRWRVWADGQRALYRSHGIGLVGAEYERVRQVLEAPSLVLAAATYRYGSWAVESDVPGLFTELCAGPAHDGEHVAVMLRLELAELGVPVGNTFVEHGRVVVEAPEVTR